MKIRGDKSFADPKNEPGLVFFVQLLDELTYEYSLDSYKAPAINAPFLIREALDQLEYLDTGGEEGLGSASHIVKELSVRLKHNVLVKGLIRGERNIQDALAVQERKPLVSTLRVLKEEVSPEAYITRIFDLIRAAIKNDHKLEIEFLARELVTTLQNAGMSRMHIHRAAVRFWYAEAPANKRSIEDLPAFLQLIFPFKHAFIVYFKASLLVDQLKSDNFESFGIRICDELDDEFARAPAAKSFIKKKEKERFVRVVASVGLTDTRR